MVIKKRPDGSYGWSQADELRFIDNLGTGGNLFRGGQSVDREKLLKGYVMSCQRRVEWGVLDGIKCRQHAEEALKIRNRGNYDL